MPIYEYECDNCKGRFERKQKIADEPIKVCPECGGQTHRVIFPVGIIFKGSGFYCTDNRSGNGGAVKPSGSTDENGKSDGETVSKAEENKSSETKSEDKKPETKASEKHTEKSAEKATASAPAK